MHRGKRPNDGLQIQRWEEIFRSFRQNIPICETSACMTIEGKQCIFPFTYKNKTNEGTEQELVFNYCSSLDVYKPWCPTAIGDDGVIQEWGECMPDCPAQEVEIVCQEPPVFPALAEDDTKSVNYTVTGPVPDEKTGEVTPGMSYIAFSCPIGYVFEDSTNNTHYAFCYNTTFDLQYDPSKKCVRKSRYLTSNVRCPTVKLQLSNVHCHHGSKTALLLESGTLTRRPKEYIKIPLTTLARKATFFRYIKTIPTQRSTMDW